MAMLGSWGAEKTLRAGFSTCISILFSNKSGRLKLMMLVCPTTTLWYAGNERIVLA